LIFKASSRGRSKATLACPVNDPAATPAHVLTEAVADGAAALAYVRLQHHDAVTRRREAELVKKDLHPFRCGIPSGGAGEHYDALLRPLIEQNPEDLLPEEAGRPCEKGRPWLVDFCQCILRFGLQADSPQADRAVRAFIAS
jgi:hypothetical protein